MTNAGKIAALDGGPALAAAAAGASARGRERQLQWELTRHVLLLTSFSEAHARVTPAAVQPSLGQLKVHCEGPVSLAMTEGEPSGKLS